MATSKIIYGHPLEPYILAFHIEVGSVSYVLPTQNVLVQEGPLVVAIVFIEIPELVVVVRRRGDTMKRLDMCLLS